MNWFRFYHEALDDPKVQRLDGETFKFWVNLLCLASRAKDRGTLPLISDIAFALRMDEDETSAYVTELVKRKLLVPIDGGFAPYNWKVRQPLSDDINARVRKHRGSSKLDETLRETLLDNDQETLPVTPSAPKRNVTRNGADKNREEESREDNDPLPPKQPTKPYPPPTFPFKPSYRDALGDSWSAFRDRFQQLDPELTEGALLAMLAEVEEDIGPLTEKQIRQGLGLTRDAIKRTLDDAKNGGKPVKTIRGLTRHLMIERLREAAAT